MPTDDVTARARAEAERRWPGGAHMFGIEHTTQGPAFIAGAEWQHAQDAETIEALRAEVEHQKRLSAVRADGLSDALEQVATLRAKVAAVEAERDDYRDNPRDEHHTMAEVYDYRMLYNAHAAAGWGALGIPVVKSWRHSDGEPCFGGGWFIVTATLPTGQVSNHYPAEVWDLFAVPEADLPPEYDGHTPQIAADRLRAALTDPEVPRD